MSSNSYNVRVFLIISLIFLLLVSSTKAENIVVVAGTNPGAICPGSTYLITDTVTSKGFNEMQFTVSNTGSSSGFTATVPPGFVLKPGQSKTIYTYISPRTTTEVGRYTLDLSVEAGNEKEIVSHTIDVRDCRSFELKSISNLKSVCPTNVEKFDFELSNSGEVTETFDLRVEGQSAPWATLSESSVTLTRQQSKIIFVYLTAPGDSLGNYDFNLIATAKSNNKVKSASATLKIEPCYDYTLTTTKDFVSLCENSQEIIPVGITNKGTVENTYNLELDGAEWADLENNKVTVLEGSTEDVNIIVSPGYGVEGDFDLAFKATTEKGKIESSNQFSVKVKKCHGVDVQIEKAQDKICTSLSNTYNVLIKNTGDFTKEYKFELIGPVWSSLERDRLELSPGEERKLSLTINPGFDTIAGDYDIIVRATALDSSKVSSEGKLTITTISREDCYRPSIGINNKEIEVYYDSAATIPVVIENKGNQQATYDIAVSGTAANFMHLNPAVVTVDPNNAEIVYLYLAPNKETINGIYSATVSVRLKDSTILASDTIQVKVTQSKVPVELIQEAPPVKKSLWQRIKELFAVKKEPEVEVPEVIEVPVIGEENVTETEVIETNETLPPEIPITGEATTEAGVESRNIDFGVANKYLINQLKNQEVVFSIEDEQHSVKVTDVSNNSVTIIVKSEPQFSNLKIGESKEFDTNNDGKNDLRVTLLGIENGKPRLVYESLTTQPATTETAEQTPETTTEAVTEVPSTTAEETAETGIQEKTNFFRLYAKYIIGGLIILVLLILVIRYRKGIAEFFEEEVEEPIKKEPVKEAKKEEPKKEAPKEEKKSPPKKKKEVSEEEYY